MKVCLNLFMIEDFSKLHQLVQSLLASEKIKEHPFKQIIIDMCSVFTGLYLGKFEEGLCFARLNLQDHIHIQNPIFTQDTLYSHIGYSYYNMGRNSKYHSEKLSFFSKAIEYFEKSLSINKHNYLVHFNMSKIYCFIGNIDQAMEQAKMACSLNKSDQNSLILCALLYSAKSDVSKALAIIEQQLRENQNKSILYLIRVSLMSDKYLQNLQKDKDLQVANQFSSTLKKFLITKHQKSKEGQHILNQLQKALHGIAKQAEEKIQSENQIGFTVDMPTFKNLIANDIQPLTFESYRNCLFNVMDLLIKVDFLDVAQELLQLVDDSSKSTSMEREYYQACILEKQDNYPAACEKYEQILKKDFYHVRTMTKLALFYLKNQSNDATKLQRANELLLVASKFDENHDIFLGKALLYQLEGNQEESMNYLQKSLQKVKNSPTLSFDIVTDKLFFF